MGKSFIHKMDLLIFVAFSLSPIKALAIDGKVVMLKGEVTWMNSPKGSVILKQGETISAGAKVKTGDKSFAKIILSDQTNLTVGPNGEVEVKTQPGSDAGLVNLVAGKLRASTPPGAKEGAPKLIIKTQKVSMGVRGTDLQATYNVANALSTLVTFEGAVEMARNDEIPEVPAGANPFASAPTVSVGPGQMSADSPNLPQVMIPIVVNPAQMETMKGNPTFADAGIGEQKKFSSPLPPGVNPSAMAADKSTLSRSLGVRSLERAVPPPVALTNGDGNRQGGFFSEKAGYIPPPANARIDENTGLPIPPASAGGLSASGDYLPPAGVKLMDNGQFALATEAKISVKVDELPVVIGAPKTTVLLSESTFIKVMAAAPISADGSINTQAIPPATLEQALAADLASGTLPGPTDDGSAGGETEIGPAGELGLSAADGGTSDSELDQLANDLANEVLADAIDDITDSSNTGTTATGRSNVTITINNI